MDMGDTIAAAAGANQPLSASGQSDRPALSACGRRRAQAAAFSRQNTLARGLH